MAHSLPYKVSEGEGGGVTAAFAEPDMACDWAATRSIRKGRAEVTNRRGLYATYAEGRAVPPPAQGQRGPP